MSRMLEIVKDMAIDPSAYVIFPFQDNVKIADKQIYIHCNACIDTILVKVGAVYKQRMRGKQKYMCKSCSAKHGWTTEKRQKAADLTKDNWHNPKYAGIIQGKAIAKAIKEQTGL